MLGRMGNKGAEASDEQLSRVMHDDVTRAISLLNLHQNPVLPVDYSDVITDPGRAAAKIKDFLSMNLDLVAMCSAVDPKLHREKASMDTENDGAGVSDPE